MPAQLGFRRVALIVRHLWPESKQQGYLLAPAYGSRKEIALGPVVFFINTHSDGRPAALGSIVLQFSGRWGGDHLNNQRASASERFTHP
jgi:hypothetical protein